MVLPLLLLVALLPKPSLQVLQNDRKGMWTAEVHYFRFKERSPVALLANRVLRKDASDSLHEFLTQAPDEMKDVPDVGNGFYFGMDPQLEEHRREPISVSIEVSTFEGGAHPNMEFSTHTFGLVGGQPRELKLKDLFRRDVDAGKVLSPLLIGRLMKTDGAEWVQEGQIKRFSTNDLGNYVVTAKGLKFLFAPYAVGPYAAGPFEVFIPYKEIRAKLDPKGPLRADLRG